MKKFVILFICVLSNAAESAAAAASAAAAGGDGAAAAASAGAPTANVGAVRSYVIRPTYGGSRIEKIVEVAPTILHKLSGLELLSNFLNHGITINLFNNENLQPARPKYGK